MTVRLSIIAIPNRSLRRTVLILAILPVALVGMLAGATAGAIEWLIEIGYTARSVWRKP